MLVPSHTVLSASHPLSGGRQSMSSRRIYYHADGTIMTSVDVAACISPMSGTMWADEVYQPPVVDLSMGELYAQQTTNVVSINENTVSRKIVMESPRNTATTAVFSSLSVPYQLTEVDAKVIRTLQDAYTGKRNAQRVTGNNAEMNSHLRQIAAKMMIDTSAPPITILCQIMAMSNNI